jgi:hypothetical protein
MQAEGGAAGFVDIVARLLTATFGDHSTAAPAAAASLGTAIAVPAASDAARGAPTPFPGPT